MSGSTVLDQTASATAQALSTTGERLVSGNELSRMLGVDSSDWARFAKNWDDLLLDTFMADGGRYRYRRYGQFELDVTTDTLSLLPHEPYRQERYFNQLNGGVDRVYEPLTNTFIEDPLLRRLLTTLGHIFSDVEGTRDTHRWLLKLHPVRIVAGESIGQPAPEGRHRDGVSYVGSLLIGRRNVRGGVSSVYDDQQRHLRTTTLSEPGDLLLGDDQTTYHEVTPIEAIDGSAPAHRDVLVLNYTAMPRRLG